MAKPITIKILGDVSDLTKKVGEADGALGKLGKGAGIMAGGLALAGTAAAAGIAVVGVQAMKSLERIETINAQTDAALKSTGAAAGVTSKHLQDLAGSIEDVSGVEAESIQQGENLLLTFTGIQNKAGQGNDIFDQTTKIMTDMAVALGTDASGSAIQLGKALNDPVNGITALTRVGVSFTDQQKDQIKALVESGDTLGAQKIILAELNKEFGGSAEAFGNTTKGKIERVKHAFGTVAETLVQNLLPGITKAAEWLLEFTRAAIPIAQKWGPRIAEVVGDVARWIGDLAAKYGPPVIEFFKKVVDAVQNFIGHFMETKDKVGSGANQVIGFFQRLWEMIRGYWEMIVAIIQKEVEVILWIWHHFGDKIVSVLKTAWEVVSTVVQDAIAFLTGLFDFIKNLVTGKWGEAWDAVVKMLGAAWDAIWTVLTGAVSIIGDVLSGVWRAIVMALSLAWNKAIEFAGNIASSIWSAISGAITDVKNALFGLPGYIVGLGASALQAALGLGSAIIDGLGQGIGKIAGFVGDIATTIKNAFIDAINFVVDLINGAIPNSLGWGPLSVDIPDNPIPHISKATGGPLASGGWIRTGERGVEDVWLPGGAQIMPAHRSGGGQNITVNVAATGASPWAIAREVAWAAKTSGR